jgi:FKBP-type peptidyl-prolyl cis-trans isomerase 2
MKLVELKLRNAKMGDIVTVHYVGTLENGRIFDQRDDDSPLSFKLGNADVFPALEKNIIGMSVGEVRNIELSAEQAYGKRRQENLIKVSRDMFPKNKPLSVGQKLEVNFVNQEKKIMRIRQFDESTVLLDGNHDLAGCHLTFALKLIEILK